MTLIIPASVTTNGTVRAVFLASVSVITAPTLAEIAAVSALDFSCYATGDGVAAETSEQNIEDPRLCSKAVYEAPGDRTDTLEITYVFNPLVPGSDEARLELTEGRKGYVLIRWGVDTDTVFAAGNIVDLYPVTLGAQRKNNPTRNSVHKITQKCFVTGAVQKDVVVAA